MTRDVAPSSPPLPHGARVLVLEDEPRLASVLVKYLQAAGYQGQAWHDGASAIDTIRAWSPQLVLLDLMLPGRDGVAICRELRTFSAVPVIMVTARVDEVDRLLGLEIGADDYICKPFSPREVIARVHAVLRRHHHVPQDAPAAAPAPRLRMDSQAWRASVDGCVLELTQVEFRLLRALAAAPGRVLSRDQLMDHAYPDRRVVTDRTVDSHIKNLRRKLATVQAEDWIRSVYGVGYRFEGG
ncbi:response regulator [Corticibacter populi]|uniref:Response regulator n=1 Tax=Corticibacter populi TaxID=1550736 RepID=A0A3M6QXH1_9BURK|nr:response regulator [Corticibacter populi]RMX07725.1 response regulator [Corticibacter populi]RZS30241.1 two-component system response regulator BaeR [Corticibacter populi]